MSASDVALVVLLVTAVAYVVYCIKDYRRKPNHLGAAH